MRYYLRSLDPCRHRRDMVVVPPQARPMLTMTDVHGLISSLRPEELAVLQERGPGQLLDREMLDAIDRAAGGPGEGRGYYIVGGDVSAAEPVSHHLRYRAPI